MSVKVIEVDASRLDQVYELVGMFDDPLPKERWQYALSAPWGVPGRPYGFAAVVDGRMVGFLGALFVERTVDGVTEQFCNLHSLILAEDHRGAGGKLLLRGLRVKGAVVTAVTPVRNVHHMLVRGGFHALDDRIRLLLPVPRERLGRGGPRWSDVTIKHGADEVLDRVDDAGAKLVNDHLSTGCDFLVAERGGRRCLVVYTNPGTRVDHGNVVHVGDHDLFAELTVPIRHELMERAGAKLVGVDTRLLRGHKPPASVDFPLDTRRLYRPPSHQPWMIDNLYTELSVLGVPAIPSVREELRQRLTPVLRRYIPSLVSD